MRPKVLIMSGYGINCEAESAHAFRLVGGKPEIVHINDLINGEKNMDDFQIIMFPGGFSYGDDTGSGNAFANKVKNNLFEKLLGFINDGKLILGVCNGFQVMVNLGLFPMPGMDYGERKYALTANTQNRYECRWVDIRHENTGCVFTKNIRVTNMPIAHGEGRFYCDKGTLKELEKNNQVVFRYCSTTGEDAEGEFPLNPNGSVADIAGICDSTGRVMGFMPHPERAIYSSSQPDYQLKKNKGNVAEHIESNLMIFRNAVEYSK